MQPDMWNFCAVQPRGIEGANLTERQIGIVCLCAPGREVDKRLLTFRQKAVLKSARPDRADFHDEERIPITFWVSPRCARSGPSNGRGIGR